jgi:hypothetical protein
MSIKNILVPNDYAIKCENFRMSAGATGNIGSALICTDSNGDASWGGSGGFAPLPSSASVLLTPNEIYNLGATGILAIPAQGTGTFILPNSIYSRLQYNSIPYAKSSPTGPDASMNLAYADGTIAFVGFNALPSAGVTVMSSTQNAFQYINNGLVNSTFASANNSPIYVKQSTGGYINGNSDVLLNISYTVET